MKITQLPSGEHELVLQGEDPDSHYVGIIAIHSTRLGPAVGGTRLWSYPTLDAARTDALRLSRGMTYKNAAAGLPLGGGKSVILRDEGKFDREAVFRAHGRFVQTLAGRYITAEDVGTSPADMAIVRKETPHTAGLLELSGDPSPITAHGVFRAIEAAALTRWGSSRLAGKRVALQGCGNVGYHLARELIRSGATLVVADVNLPAAQRLENEFGAEVVEPRTIHRAKVDIFAPCALGGIVNAQTIPELECQVVAGAANNQLLEDADAGRLDSREILYIPDYIANAGGVINGSREILGWSAELAAAKVEGIFDTTLEVLREASAQGISTARAADNLAHRRLAAKQQ